MKGALEIIRSKTALEPRFGLVLGSGLGSVADMIDGAVRFSNNELTGLPTSNVSSHESELILGTISGVPVALFSGRVHYYEQGDAAVMKPAIELLALLGCENVILTNSAGSLHEDMGAGEVLLISDHINWSGFNPLVGVPSDQRFVSMSDAYDPQLSAALTSAANAIDYDLKSGVYVWFPGPSFETPAEIRATAILGGDAVGMSTVPEVILTRFYGMKAAALSSITNLAAGMNPTALSHEETMENGPLAAEKIVKILRRFFEDLPNA